MFSIKIVTICVLVVCMKNVLCQEELGTVVSRKVHWVEVTGKEVPENSIYIGHDINGYQGAVYVGRGRVNGSVIPGKFAAWQGRGYIITEGQNHLLTTFEVLTSCAPVEWVPGSGLTVMPPKAIVGGRDRCGKDLFICRVPYQDTSVTGRLDVEAQTCTISVYSIRVYKEYDVLVLK